MSFSFTSSLFRSVDFVLYILKPVLQGIQILMKILYSAAEPAHGLNFSYTFFSSQSSIRLLVQTCIVAFYNVLLPADTFQAWFSLKHNKHGYFRKKKKESHQLMLKQTFFATDPQKRMLYFAFSHNRLISVNFPYQYITFYIQFQSTDIPKFITNY